MDMGFDHDAWPVRQRALCDPGTESGIDWQGLRGRFIAAQAYRATVAQTPPAAVDQVGHGSFHRAAADALAAFAEASPAVNPNDLADGKRLTGIASEITGTKMPGGQG
jgi:hypothetical protein